MQRDPYNDYPPSHHNPNPYYNPDPPTPNPYYNPEPVNTENNSYPTGSSYNQRDPDPYVGENYYAESMRQQQRSSEPYLNPYQDHPSEKLQHLRTRNFGTILVSVLLYLCATACGFLGLTGLLLAIAPNFSSSLQGF